MRSSAISAILAALLLSLPFIMASPLIAQSDEGQPGLPSIILGRWDDASFMATIDELCNISAQHPAFRVSGSPGADEAADYILSRFQEMGLEAYDEGFELPRWNLLGDPRLEIDLDGDEGTADDVVAFGSFNTESYSLPTPLSGLFAEVVTLPLPAAASSTDIGWRPIDAEAWSEVNTTGKVLLMGREVRWSTAWEEDFKEKIEAEPPAAIIFYYSYDWMDYTDLYSQASTGGMPLGNIGPIYWDLGIVIGTLNQTDGLAIREMIDSFAGTKARMMVRSEITEGLHRNIVAELPSSNSNRYVLMGAHYDTVLCDGFVDNTIGLATVIETARVVKEAIDAGEIELNLGLRFVAFAGEELGLAGSLNFVDSHREEMTDAAGVIVVDSIGSSVLYATDPPFGDPDLSEHASASAEALGVPLIFQGSQSSDHSSFMFPQGTAQSFNWNWRTDIDLAQVDGVPNSMMFYSYPITIYDDPSGGNVGYIHTPLDSINGATGSGWVDPEVMKAQAKTVALTLVRSTSMAVEDEVSIWYIIVPICAGAAVVGSVIIRRRGRKRP